MQKLIRIAAPRFALLLLAGTALPILAQTVPAPAVDPAADPAQVTTADRRPAPLQSAPVAVTVFTLDMLDARGIRSTQDLGSFVPNMIATPGIGLASAYGMTLRGLGSGDPLAGLDPAVGTFVDGVALAGQGANTLGLFDLERVEVLRGPQTALMGRNTSAGAIDVRLKAPGSVLGGYGELGYGANHNWLIRASLDVPLGSSAAIKLSGYDQNDKGFVHNSTTGERMNESDAQGIRAALRLGDGNSLSWNGAVALMRNTGENLLNFACDPAHPADCSGRFATTGMLQGRPLALYDPYAPASVSGDKASYPLGNVTKTVLVTSDLRYAGDGVMVDLITGAVRTTRNYAIDLADGRGFPTALVPVPPVRGFAAGGYALLGDDTVDGFSQEVKLSGSVMAGRLDWLLGATFDHERRDSDRADLLDTGTPVLLADRRLLETRDAKAGYGQLDLHVSGGLTVSGGVRYTDEKATFSVRDNRAQCQGNAAPATCLTDPNLSAGGTAIPTTQHSQHWTPRLVASWQQSPALMVYASASGGYQAGGWNTRGVSAATLLPYAPEKSWSYELGVRSQWFDDRLRVNLTGFVLDVSDVQVASASVAPVGGLAFTTANAADYRNKGVELELSARPIDRLTLTASAGYQSDHFGVDATAADFNAYGVRSAARQQRDCRAELAAGKIPLGSGASNAASCASGIIDAHGGVATPPRTPSVTIAAGASWDYPIAAAGITLSPTVNVIWRSAFETGSANATLYTGSVSAGLGGTVYPANPFGGDVISGSHTAATTLVNAQIAMTTNDKAWLVVLECANCFDATFGQASLGNFTTLNAPRTWTIRARRAF